MAVTPDRYELPLCVSDLREEVAAYGGVIPITMSTAISQKQSGKTRGIKFVKVEVDEDMKHGKAPTVNQKKFIRENGLKPETWLVERETQTEMILLSRNSKSKRILKKG